LAATKKDRESVKKDKTWACPACVCLTDSEKESRHHFAETEELKVVTFDLHPTNPLLDIQPTGHCAYWAHERKEKLCRQ